MWFFDVALTQKWQAVTDCELSIICEALDKSLAFHLFPISKSQLISAARLYAFRVDLQLRFSEFNV